MKMDKSVDVTQEVDRRQMTMKKYMGSRPGMPSRCMDFNAQMSNDSESVQRAVDALYSGLSADSCIKG